MSDQHSGPETPQKPALTSRQELAATMLAAGKSVASTARALRVNATTVWDWYRKPVFKERVAERRNKLVDGAIGRLSNLMAKEAVDSLLQLVKEAKSEGVRLEAIRTVYETFVNITSAAELKERLEMLEAQLKGK